MTDSHIDNPASGLIFEDLIQNIEKQKSDIEILRKHLTSESEHTQKTILEFQNKEILKIQELEEERLKSAQSLEEKSKKIENLESKLNDESKNREHSLEKLRNLLTTQVLASDEQRKRHSITAQEQENELFKLTKDCSNLRKEIIRLKKIERLLIFIKYRCIRAYAVSKGVWKFRSWSALKFMEFSAKLLDRYKFFTQEELEQVFPKKIKKTPNMEITIPSAEEKKKKIRDWKTIWLWKKDKK